MRNQENEVCQEATIGIQGGKYNPLEQMENEIKSLKIENQRLRNECLGLYRRITNYED